MKKIIVNLRNLSIKIQLVISVLCFLCYGFSSSMLDTSYQASRFPVPYYIGQTSFDASKIKAWYQYMIDAGTFDIYFKTQFIDFVFILSVVLGGFFIWTFFASLHARDSFFRRTGYQFAFLLPLAGLFDIWENLVSFFMMANPIHFYNGIALIYSAFAVVKFVFWGLALTGLTLVIIAWVVIKVSKVFTSRSTVAS
jgi:hypothetical protein